MDDREKLLYEINARLARVEGRLEDLPEIKRSLDSLKGRVARISGGVSLFISLLGTVAGVFFK